MKKLILLIMALLISAQAMAISCQDAGGMEIKGNNGTVYCKSNRTMNWWTAMAWCEKIGKTPFSYPKDCACETSDGIPCPETTAGCPNLAGVGGDENIWTSTPFDTSYAYNVNLSSGNSVYTNATRVSSLYYALCY